MKKFTSTTWRLLDERLQSVLAGGVFKKIRKRTFYYACRLAFQKEWKLKEIDLTGPASYSSWGTCVNTWASKHCADLGIPEGRFWEVLGRLNIWPHERGVCFRYGKIYSKDGVPLGDGLQEIMVNHETKDKIQENCSFIIVSEKETLCHELWDTLTSEGYRATIIAMGGHSTGTVQSLVAEVADELQRLQTENFFILSLHDFDLDGIMMVANLRKWFPWVIDAGINRGFLQFNKIDKDRLIWEVKINRKDIMELRNFVRTAPEYTGRDLTRLHGEQTATKRWEGKRVEIDSVYAKYGIDPFVNYIKDQLKDIACWDLTRIGVTEFELEEPINHYEDAIEKLEDKIGLAYGLRIYELSKNLNQILGVINNILSLPSEFTELKEKYRGNEKTWWTYQRGSTYYRYTRSEILGEEFPELTNKYSEDMYREWVPDYEDELKEINDQLTCYKGDVTTAKEEVESQFDVIQESLDNDKSHDETLEEFEEKLLEVEWGEEELNKIETPDPIGEIDSVIKVLEELKLEIQEYEI